MFKVEIGENIDRMKDWILHVIAVVTALHELSRWGIPWEST